MIRINLLPVREVEQASSRRKEIILIGGLLILTCVGMATAYFLQGRHINEVNAELKQAERMLETVRRQNQEFEKLEHKQKNVEDKIQVVSLLTSPQRRSASVHVLDDLSVSTPEGLWLTDFIENKGAARIIGKAVDNQTIASFAYNLSNSTYFRNIEIRETVQEVPTNTAPQRRNVRAGVVETPLAPPVTKFVIEARINYVPGTAEGTEAQESTERPKEGKSPPVKNQERKG